jgi:V/A-type H+-transporting ATPase subunit E
MNDTAQPNEAGIRELVRKLHEDGVESGRKEAQRLVEEARQHAAKIVNDARHEAETLLQRARETADRESAAARQALALAVRDAILTLKEGLKTQFAMQLQSLLDRQLREEDLLRQMLLALAGSASPQLRADGGPEIVVSAASFEGRSAADDLIAAIARDMLLEGVTLRAAPLARAGIVARLNDGQVELAFTDDAVAEVLRSQLLPRFHDLLSGAVE